MTRNGRPGAPRWLIGVVVAMVLIGGCAQNVPGVPAAAPGDPGPGPAPGPGSTATAPAAGAPPSGLAPATGGCQVTISGRSVRMSGGGQVRSGPSGQRLACRNGPLIDVEAIGADGVRFRLDEASVLVAAGATGQLGPYRITVRELDPPDAQFDVAPA